MMQINGVISRLRNSTTATTKKQFALMGMTVAFHGREVVK